MSGDEPTGRRRRAPRQERSRAMVERIVTAARDVVLEQGYDGASTNRIASAAGISPGSFYQYFPDKHAVLGEVLDRYSAEMEARVSDAFVTAIGQSADDVTATIRSVVVAMLDTFAEHPRLMRILVEQVPRSESSRRHDFARRIDQIALGVLAARLGPGHGRSVEAMAWVLVRTVEAVTVAWVLEAPPIDRDALVDEVVRLVFRYLDGP